MWVGDDEHEHEFLERVSDSTGDEGGDERWGKTRIRMVLVVDVAKCSARQQQERQACDLLLITSMGG